MGIFPISPRKLAFPRKPNWVI